MAGRAESRLGATNWAAMRQWLAWVSAFAAAVTLALLAFPGLARYGPSAVFAVFGAACFATRRMYHCMVTGPAFLLIAGAIAFAAAGVWELSPWLVGIATGAALVVGFALERAYSGRKPA